MIGFWNEMRQTAKPIYKENRIVLGKDGSSERIESFINANEVYPGIIVTQCPLVEYPNVSSQTLSKVIQQFDQDNLKISQFNEMVLEQNATLIIQLHPYVLHEDDEKVEIDEELCERSPFLAECRWPCLSWVKDIFQDSQHPLSKHVESVYVENRDYYTKYTYKLSGRLITHYWYKKWVDFQIPPSDSSDFFRYELSREVKLRLGNGEKVVITCYSGRGRSGSLAALLVGILSNMTSKSEVIDAIVRMRESRDGVVEIPSQLSFIFTVLNLKGGPLKAAENSATREPYVVSLTLRIDVIFVVEILVSLLACIVISVFIFRPYYKRIIS